MAEFENLGGSSEHVTCDDAAEGGTGDMVNVMTLHSAKAEFDSVFLPGWEEGVFPNQRGAGEAVSSPWRRSGALPMSG